MRPGVGNGGEEPVVSAMVLCEGAQYHRRRCDFKGNRRAEGSIDRGGQHRVRTGLDEALVAVRLQGPDGLVEPDGLAQVVDPVLCGQLAAIEEISPHRRAHRDLPGDGINPVQGPDDLVGDGVDLRAVRGVVHRQPPRPHPLLLTRRHPLLEGIAISGDHGRAGTVDHRHGQPALPGLQTAGHVFRRQCDRNHATPTRQRPQGL